MRYLKILSGLKSVKDRAEKYRDRALQLERLAEAEAYGRLRDQLAALARQYQELAESLLQAADD